jgi:hypothetical protein
MEMAVAAMASGRPPSLGGSLSTRLDKLEAAGGDHDGDRGPLLLRGMLLKKKVRRNQ